MDSSISNSKVFDTLDFEKQQMIDDAKWRDILSTVQHREDGVITFQEF